MRVPQARPSGDPASHLPEAGSLLNLPEGDAVKKTKEKILLALEQDVVNAEMDMARWQDAVKRYNADLLFQEEQGFTPNALTIESRAAAKEALDRAKETRRLYTVAVDAVRKA